jgi:hypothetical protein
MPGRQVDARATIEERVEGERLLVRLSGGIDGLVCVTLWDDSDGTRVEEAVGYRVRGALLGQPAGAVLDRRLTGRLHRHLDSLAGRLTASTPQKAQTAPAESPGPGARAE